MTSPWLAAFLLNMPKIMGQEYKEFTHVEYMFMESLKIGSW
jgi:hypothetical protein